MIQSPRRFATASAAALLVVLGICWCARLLAHTDWLRVSAEVRRMGSGALLIIAAPAVSNYVHMLGWRRLLPETARPGHWRAFRVFVAAQAGNEIGFGLLGETAKVTMLPERDRAHAIRAVIADNASALLALCAIVLTLGACVWTLLPERTSLLQAAAVAVLLASALGHAAARRRAVSARALDGFGTAFALHYLAKVWVVAEMGLGLALLGEPARAASVLLGLASTLGAAIGAPVPGQLGVVDGAIVAAGKVVALKPAALITLVIVRRFRSLVWIGIGGLCALAGSTGPVGRQ